MRAPHDDGPTRGSLRLLQVTAFVSTIDRFAMPPMLLAMSRDLGVPLHAVVTAAGVYYLTYGAMQPVWGMVSDRIGRVRTLRLTLVLAAFATAVSALVGGVTGLTIARGVAGAFFSAAFPASLIYIGDTVPSRRRQPAIAGLLIGVALGTALASVGAGALAQLVSWRATFLVTGAAALVLAVVLRRLPEPAVRPEPGILGPLRQVATSPVALLVLLLAFVEGGVLLGMLTLLPAAIESAGAGPALAGAVTAVYGLAVFVGAWLVASLSRRWPVWRLIALGGVCAVAACAVAAVSQEAAVAGVVAVLLGLAWSAMHSSLQTWVTQVLPGARATVVSLFAGTLFAGSAFASAVVAGPAGRGAFDAIFAWTAVVAVPLTFVAAGARARWHPPPDPFSDAGPDAGPAPGADPGSRPGPAA
jgi:predicted MFS family arabinose efflux permease